MNPNHLLVCAKPLCLAAAEGYAPYYSAVNDVSFFPSGPAGLLRLLFIQAVGRCLSGMLGKARVNNLGESLISLWASH
jgi:hypothetical protein